MEWMLRMLLLGRVIGEDIESSHSNCLTKCFGSVGSNHIRNPWLSVNVASSG